MTEKVYLLQSVEENFWWKKTLSALGVATCDFNPSLKQTVLMNSVGKRLLFADRRQLLHEISESNPCIQQWISHGGSIVVTGPESSEKFVFTFPVEDLCGCVELFVINQILVRYLEKYSRQFARVDTQLPALFVFEKQPLQFCEVLNLSVGGARIKTSRLPPPIGADICIHLALMGFRKEIDFSAKIVRHIAPSDGNKYKFEFCVEIAKKNSSIMCEINDYIDNFIKNKYHVIEMKNYPLSMGCQFSAYSGKRGSMSMACLN